MTQMSVARLCCLYRKLKSGDKNAIFALEKFGLNGNRIEVLRSIELIVKKNFSQICGA